MHNSTHNIIQCPHCAVPATGAEQSVIGIIRDLASFTASEDIIDLSRARAQINRLAQTSLDIAQPLWEITLYLQRALTDLGNDDAAQ